MSTAVSTEVLQPKPDRWVRYDPMYCDDIIEFMAMGHSATAFAGDIGVHRGTLYDWRDAHVEFKEAMLIGQAKRVLFWERVHRMNTISGKGNIVGSIFALKNADPTDPDGYRDRHEIIGMPTPPAVDETLIAQRVAFILMQGLPRQ